MKELTIEYLPASGETPPSVLFVEPAPALSGKIFNILMVISRPGGPEKDVAFQSVARPLLELFRPHRRRIHLESLKH